MRGKKLAEQEALEIHNEMMCDPEYAAKWNDVVGQVFGALCDIPEEALKRDGRTEAS